MSRYHNDGNENASDTRLKQLCHLISKAQEEVQAHKQMATKVEQSKLRTQALCTQMTCLEKGIAKQKRAYLKLENSTCLVDFLFYSLCNFNGRTKKDEMEQLLKDTGAKQEKLCVLKKEMKYLDKNILSWEREAALLSSAQRRYNKLFAEKKSLILGGSDLTAKTTLQASCKKQAQLEQDIALLDTAVTAGKSLIFSLRTVQSHLNSAANWGTADMMGGGMMVTMAKRNAIDRARHASKKTKKDMEQFSHVLNQLGQNMQHDLDCMSGFSAFADYFLDGIFIDWHVQSQISKASGSCRAALLKTSTILRETEGTLAKRRDDVEQCNQEQTALVLSAGQTCGLVTTPDISPHFLQPEANGEISCY